MKKTKEKNLTLHFYAALTRETKFRAVQSRPWLYTSRSRSRNRSLVDLPHIGRYSSGGIAASATFSGAPFRCNPPLVEYIPPAGPRATLPIRYAPARAQSLLPPCPGRSDAARALR